MEILNIDFFYGLFYRYKISNSTVKHGSNLKIGGKLNISYEKSVIIGSSVKIGPNASWLSEGGVIVGDNVEIEENVKIISAIPHEENPKASGGAFLFHPKQVVIESNRIIRKNTILKAGTRVTDSTNSKNIKKFNRTTNGQKTTLRNAKYPPVFILSTGRAGSASLTYTLSKHSNIYIQQESRRQLNYLSSAYSYNLINRKEIKEALDSLYNLASIYPRNTFIIESDQKFTGVIEILDEIFPECKFIWLLRNGKDFVSSAAARGWMSDIDTGNNYNDIVINKKLPSLGMRINGYKCGEFSKYEWDNLDVFGRNCWYWSYWNGLTEEKLSQVDKTRWMQVKLEELSLKMKSLQEFIGVQTQDLDLLHANKVKPQHKLISFNEWSDLQKETFYHWTNKNMNRWYPELVE